MIHGVHETMHDFAAIQAPYGLATAHQTRKWQKEVFIANCHDASRPERGEGTIAAAAFRKNALSA
jgi:hypothetical protein